MKDTERELRQKIELADKAYYDEDKPIMSDEEYDKLRRSYEEEYGSLDYVPGDIKNSFTPFTHPFALLSLDKLFDDDPAVETKLKTIVKKFGSICVQPKIDGLTVAGYPQDDGTYTFVTRGRGGITGEVLPAFIPVYDRITGLGNVTVRGEAFITKQNFEEILSLQRIACEELFSNPRNAAAGILRNKEKSPYLKYLSYVVYEIPGSELSVKDQLGELLRTQFTVVESKIPEGDLLLFIRDYYQELLKGTMPVDGIVIKAYKMDDSLNKLGQTQHHPNNAVAWKRAADVYETKIKSVTWQTGRDKITPVAELDLVEIDGTTISRATLHNLGFFKKLALRRGDTISICKSGEVIPKVLSVTKHGIGLPITVPVECPSCKDKLEIFSHDDIADLRCVNPDCPERIVQNIAYLASKDVLDIKGLSESTARKIVEMFGTEDGELVIFNLTVKDILKLPGFAQKSAENLYNSLLQSLNKPVTIPVLFKACCTTGIGGTVGAALEKRFKDISTIVEALNNYKLLRQVEGIGDKIAQVLTSSVFKTKFNSVLELLVVEDKVEEKSTGALSGTVWVITGKLPVSRAKIESLIQSNGGEVTGNVSRRTDYLLTADITSNSTKSKKAQELGVKIVTYDYLLGLIS